MRWGHACWVGNISGWRIAHGQDMSQPFTLLNYLEGTRFTPEKHEQQQSPYKHLLKPKAGGLALALNILGNEIDALVDMTIVYPDGAPDYGEFWLGEVPRIAVNLRKIDIPDWVLVATMKKMPPIGNVFRTGCINSGQRKISSFMK